VIPANILPMDSSRAIDEPAYRDHLRHLAEVDGVTGIVCNGHAAEVSSLSDPERRRALEIALEMAAGEVNVISGILALSEDEAVDQARTAEQVGADALLLFPPELLHYADEPSAAVSYVSAVARRVSLPLIVFMYPQSTGLQYSAETLKQLCAIDSVAAVKEWSLDIATYERTLDIVRSQGDVSLLTSFSTHLLPSLALGADGILSGHGSVIAPLQVQLMCAVEAGDLPAARSLYNRIQTLTRVIYRAPLLNSYTRMKEQLVMLGAPMQSWVRPPLQPVSSAERDRLRTALTESGLLVKP